MPDKLRLAGEVAADFARQTRAEVDASLARIPQFASFGDVADAFPTRDLLLDAYVNGWLPDAVARVLEDRPERLSCWLLARLLRLQLQGRP